jgi:cytochrome c551
MIGPLAARGAIVALAGLAMTASVHAQTAKLSPAGEGRRVYMKLNCYGCHGIRGAGGMGPSLREDETDEGRSRREVGETDELAEKVLHGAEEGMPKFSRYVDQTDIANLTAYIRSLGGPNEPVFDVWWKKNPPR